MLKPLVSIIIPAFNSGEYIVETIVSVLQQSHSPIEVIVVDDGSTDDTRDKLTNMIETGKIRYQFQANRGPSAARNTGIRLAKGQYFQFLDADDWIAPTKFELQLPELESTKAISFSYTDYQHYFDDPALATVSGRQYASPKLIGDKPLVHLASKWEYGLSIPIHCFLFDARFFTELGIRFDETLPNHEDWDCWMQILATEPQIFYVAENLATYRYRGDAVCADFRAMRIGFLRAIRKQRRIFSKNKEMHVVLSEKLRSVDSQYRDYALHRYAYRHARQRMSEGLRALMPDGVRRILKNSVLDINK